MTGAPDIELRLVSFLPWDDRVTPSIGPRGPAPGAGAIEIPGHRPLPVRTTLEPAVGPGGLVGRIVDPDGTSRPVAVRLDDAGVAFIQLDTPPLALAPRSDGVWSMDGDRLTTVATSGEIVSRIELSGMRMLAAPDDAVWVLGTDRCWFVDSSGASEFGSPWRNPFDTCLIGDLLVGWDPELPTGVISLNPAGSIDRRDLGLERGLFERPLAVGERHSLSAVLRTLVHRDSTGDSAVMMTGAGMTAAGVPFFAGHVDDRTWLWLVGSPASELASTASEQVVAVTADRVLTWSGERPTWWDRDTLQPGPTADDIDDPEAIVEVGWTQDTPFPFVAAPDAEVLFASSGPPGIAVLGLRMSRVAGR